MSGYKLPKRLHPAFAIPNRKPLIKLRPDESASLSRSLVSFGALNEYKLTTFRDSADDQNTFTVAGSTNWDIVDGEICLDVNQDTAGVERVLSTKTSLSSSLDWTVNQKIYRRFDTVSNIILSQYAPGEVGRFYVELQDGGNFRVLDSAGFHTITIAEPPKEEWLQVAIWRRNGTYGVVINGVESTSNPTSGGTIYQGVATSYGGVDLGFGSLRGWISNFQVYNRALTYAEILLIQRDNYASLKPATPQVYFVPEAGGGSTVEASASFSQTFGFASSKNAIIDASASFNQSYGMTQGGAGLFNTDAQAGAVLNISAQSIASINTQISIGITSGIVSDANIITNADAVFNTTQTTISAGGLSLAAAANFVVNYGISSDSDISIEALADFSMSSGVLCSAIAQMDASINVSVVQSAVAETIAIINANAAYGVTSGLTVTRTIVTDAGVSFAITSELTADGAIQVTTTLPDGKRTIKLLAVDRTVKLIQTIRSIKDLGE